MSGTYRQISFSVVVEDTDNLRRWAAERGDAACLELIARADAAGVDLEDFIVDELRRVMDAAGRPWWERHDLAFRADLLEI